MAQLVSFNSSNLWKLQRCKNFLEIFVDQKYMICVRCQLIYKNGEQGKNNNHYWLLNSIEVSDYHANFGSSTM